MRVLVVRHHEEDDAGFIADAFHDGGAAVTDVLLTDGVRLPDPTEFGHLVVLGAVSSVNDEHAWIAAELEWLRRADAAGVPILGICFGAQALCVATGGAVQRAPRQQIGWMTVETTDPGLVPAGPWLEFHSDRCLTPAGARILARDDLCTQAYSIRRHLGVQFHPEVDGKQLKRWLDMGGAADVAAAGIDADEFIAQTVREEPAARTRADRLVHTARELASLVTGPAVG